MKSLLFSFTSLLLCQAVAQAQNNELVARGNEFYRQQQFDKAEAQYRRALENAPANKIAKFNLANTLIREGRSDDAEKLLASLNVSETSPNLRANATYNEGVMFSQQKKLERSIEQYEETLRLNPHDQQARENLQKALLELKKKNPPRQEENKKKQQQQKQQPQPKISKSEAEQQLKLLEQKEKQVQEKLQKNPQTGTPQPKDW